MPPLQTSAAYQPTGDQPQAIATLSKGLLAGERYQTLLGATGTGKTATMAWIIEQVQKPALIIAHNKTLAAQLCNEFREFFPTNAEAAAAEKGVVPGVLDVDELPEHDVAVDLHADAEEHRLLLVLDRRAEAVDAGDRGDDDDVAADE